MAAAAPRRGVVVLGGNGFVGSAVCRRAIRSTHLSCTSIARSGPPSYYKSWMKDVSWKRGDAAKLSQHREVLSQAKAVISCVGAFGSQEHMEHVCGDVNVAAMKEAKEAGVPRFVYVSVQPLPGMRTMLSGYIRGKAKAERTLTELYGRNGVSIRPTMIYGMRRVRNIPLPLGVVGAPLALLNSQLSMLRHVPLVGGFFLPPVNVDAVAQVALMSAVDESLSGVLSVDDIVRLTNL